MLGKSIVSVAVGMALFAATVRLPAAGPCFLTKVASAQACKPDCCANKTCCKTTRERTGVSAQPLAKASLGQQNIAPVPATILHLLPMQIVTAARVVSAGVFAAHSPPTLALICIRLI